MNFVKPHACKLVGGTPRGLVPLVGLEHGLRANRSTAPRCRN